MTPKVVRHSDYVPGCHPKPYRYVGRPSVWGNPYVIGKDGTREEVIAKYREYLARRPAMVARAKTELRGKSVRCPCGACWKFRDRFELSEYLRAQLRAQGL